jgi:putative transposase
MAVSHVLIQAESREEAYPAFDNGLKRFEPKYPKAMACLAKDQDSLRVFYDCPAQNWQPIRTPNPLNPSLPPSSLRTTQTRNCGSRATTLARAFKLMETTRKKWLQLPGYQFLADVIRDVKFVNGIKQTGDQQQEAA